MACAGLHIETLARLGKDGVLVLLSYICLRWKVILKIKPSILIQLYLSMVSFTFLLSSEHVVKQQFPEFLPTAHDSVMM